MSATTHVVQAGETVQKIADRYKLSTEAIFWANDLSVDDSLVAGTILKIPPVSGVVYTVKPGDTLSQIAGHYSVNMDDIIRVNNLKDAASIRDGVDLMIPGAARDVELTDSRKDTKVVKNTNSEK